MALNVAKELAALRKMTHGELRVKYAEVFGEATLARNKPWLVKRIAWRMQAQAEGGLSERARQRALELANDADVRMMPPKEAPVEATNGKSAATKGDRRVPLPGSTITREYKGETLQVKVRTDGFEYEGEVFKTLSAVAKKITGQHCNGYYFFRLGQDGGAK